MDHRWDLISFDPTIGKALPFVVRVEANPSGSRRMIMLLLPEITNEG